MGDTPPNLQVQRHCSASNPRSPEGVAWVEEEFEALWEHAHSLPDAIVPEIKRVADRIEIAFADAGTGDAPAAALAESPLYRGGE